MNVKVRIPRKMGDDEIRAIRRLALRAAVQIAVSAANRYPGPVKRPIRWASARQRRAYYAAMRRAGDAPPYRRGRSRLSQNMAQAWQFAIGETRATIRNKARYAVYVIGRAQQPFHKATGWVVVDKAIARADWRALGRILKARVKVI